MFFFVQDVFYNYVNVLKYISGKALAHSYFVQRICAHPPDRSFVKVASHTQPVPRKGRELLICYRRVPCSYHDKYPSNIIR